MNFAHPTYSDLFRQIERQNERIAQIDRFTPPSPLLITGITGVAGYNALAYFQSRFPGKVFGILPPDTIGFSAPDCYICNMEDLSELRNIFDTAKFRSVLDCAGNCALKACQLDPKIAWSLNVDVIQNLVKLTRHYGIRLVHLSVDMVFGGRPGGGYREDESPCPVNVYGQTMVEGENAVASEDPTALTLRISMPMGLSFNGHAGAIDWIGARFKMNRPATLYYDEVRTPTYTDCMNRIFRIFVGNETSGILNCGGPRQVSLYQMAQIINRVGGFSPDLLFGLMKDESCPVPPRVSNCGLDSSAMERLLGFPPFDPWPWDERFMPTSRDWHYHRQPGEQGSVAQINQVLNLNPNYTDCH
ncbi:MAG: sugar nucleotide-binding protein [Thermoguttaceae bacterium]|nr:sugar nucleotide-binding protein [Thermoguttaceae bacterium]